MQQDKKGDQLTHQQKYCLFLECCFWAYQIAVVALALAIMALTIVCYERTRTVLGSGQYKHANQTVWLWNQGYIIDIKVERTNNCPQGYQPLIKYEWPGTNEGCYCISRSNGYDLNFVLQGKCTSQLISLGCDSVTAVSPQILNMWKGSRLLCYKRAQRMNFYNSVLTTAPSGGTSSSMSACAVNTDHQVHTLPGVPCPVSAISNNTLGASQTSLPLDSTNTYRLNFISSTGYPVADIKLSQYNFCEFYNESNISPDKKGEYILQKVKLTAPCAKNDPRMVTIDGLNQQDFYKNNTRVYERITSLPAFPTPSVDYTYKLGYIPYPSWSFSCRNNKQYNLQTTTKHILFQDSSNALSITVGIVVGCTAIFVVLFRLFYIIRHIIDFRNKSTYNVLNVGQDEIIEQIPNLDIKKSYKKQVVLFLIQLVLILAVLGAMVYSIYVLTDNSKWIKQIIKNKCTDSFLQDIFTYYESQIDYMAATLIAAAIISGVLFLVHIIYFCTRTKAGDLFSKNQVVAESVPSQYEENAQVLAKQEQIEGINIQNSGGMKKEGDNSELQIYDIDFLMGEGAGQTKDNFYSLERDASIVVSKKKKKKTNRVRKSLFKDK